MIRYTSCPICKSENIQEQLSAKDFTVSQTEFSIWHCNYCTVRFTQDVPGPDEIGAYYASDNYISHTDTKKGFINGLYHLVRKRTLSSKRKLIVKEGGKERGANSEAWTNSYWTLPPAGRREKPFFLIDVDSGIETQVTMQNLGKDSQIVEGQRVSCTHYRVTGNGVLSDVWFDDHDRLVRREGLRKGKKVTLQLLSATVR